jgi:hypothetical protein
LKQSLNLEADFKNVYKENAEAVGSDEVFFDGDPVNIKDLYNEKSGILDGEDDDDVDLASYCYQLWQNGCDKHPELRNIIPELPNVVYATKKAENREASLYRKFNMAEGEVSPYGRTRLRPTPSPRGAAPKTPLQPGGGVIVYAKTNDDNDSLAWVDEKGNMVSQSPPEILKALKCDYDEPSLSRQEQHHALTSKAIEYISEFNDTIGGQLGRKNGARYRAFTRLDQWLLANKDGLFITEEIKRVHQDIYRFPLKEDAVDAINREFKSGIDNERLVEMLCSMNEQDKLCIKNEDEQESKEARVICSMGLA